MKLLSVVVPTKNRVIYLKSLIEIFNGFTRQDIELVIEDNSDDNTEILSYLQRTNNKNIIYNYDSHTVSVVENSDRAILHSSGKYVCFLGDDDLFSELVGEFVEFMDRNSCDSAIFQVAKYYWPGTEFKAHKFPNLVIKRYKGKVKTINVKKEIDGLLSRGATSLNMMPKVYHGIVSRKCLDEIYNITGSYFPGPSPDMANSVALSFVVKKHIYCDVPYISSGTSPKSTAGLGAKHMHKGNIKDISFLPEGVEDNWNINIPKVWTGPTIYAQSALESLLRMGGLEEINKYNFNYLYAYFRVYCGDYTGLLSETKKNSDKYNVISYIFSLSHILLDRTKRFIQNRIMLKKHNSDYLYEDINSTFDAEKIIDDKIKDVVIEDLFEGFDK